MTEHTKEPWLVDGDYLVTEGGSRIAAFTHYADAKRVQVCVDACEGMQDPQKYIQELSAYNMLLVHKLITCGVAASHPDANLSKREKDYGGKWDSPQAQEVRKVRQQRDELLAALKLCKFDSLNMTINDMKIISAAIIRAESAQ